jgi:hypothetical protein
MAENTAGWTELLQNSRVGLGLEFDGFLAYFDMNDRIELIMSQLTDFPLPNRSQSR